MSQAVEQFLWDVMGYRGIERLVIGLKPPEQTVRAFLAGTVFGTFGTTSVYGTTTLPNISKIRSMKEIDFSARGPDRRHGQDVPEEKRGNIE